MDTNKKLELLRAQLKTLGIDALIIPHADAYLSEYLSPDSERLAWLTGFTGSSGMAVVTPDDALALTDSRYTIQIMRQVDGKAFACADMANVTVPDWLKEKFKKPAVVGFDPDLHTAKQIADWQDKLQGTGITLKPLDINPIDSLWNDRPAPPMGLAEIFPDEVAGRTSEEKRKAIAENLRAAKIDSVIISRCDSICWLLNVRGNDIAFNPLVLSQLILHAKDGTVDWFVEDNKILEDVRDALGLDVRLQKPAAWHDTLKALSGTVQIDPERSPLAVRTYVDQSSAKIVLGKDPCVMPKACKTDAEQHNIRQVHIRDGVTMVRFLMWLDAQRFEHGHINEIFVAERLEDFRRANATYRGPSFATICGWNANGAIVHYHAEPDTNQKIIGNGFLLIDSGAQYEYGTTDITRTIPIGDISAKMKEHYTCVLKGHIAVARTIITPEMTGADIDARARAPLSEVGLDYGHSTGHGVGCFLSVHEEASGISPRGKDTYEPGMLLSNEPGLYIEGEYGIRHENLMLCQRNPDTGMMFFDTVTLVPFDTQAINWDIITADEKEWLENYHHHVFDMLHPFLDELELDWLQERLFPKPPRELTPEEAALNLSAYD